MDTRRFHALFLLVMFFPAACSHRVHHVTGDKPIKAPGIIYALPRTIVRVEIPVTKTTYLAGPYIAFAEQLGIEVPAPLKEQQEVDQLLKAAPSAVQDRFTGDAYAALFEEILELDEAIVALDAKKLEFELAKAEAGDAKEVDAKQASIDVIQGRIDLAEERKSKLEAGLRGQLDDDKQRFDGLVKRAGFQKTDSFALGAPTITALAEPDPEHVYLIEMKSTPAQDRLWFAKLTDLGILTSAKTELHDRTVEYVVAAAGAALRTAASFAGGLPGGGVAGERFAPEKPPSPLDIAAGIAERIHEIRDKRAALFTDPQAKLDVPTLRARLEELQKAEDSLLAAFYVKKVTAGVVTYDALPGEQTFERTILRFDKKIGLAAKDPLDRVRIPAAFKGPATGVDVVVKIVRDPSADSARNVSEAKQKALESPFGGYSEDKASYRYRIPGLGLACLYVDDKIFSLQRMPIAQFGTVFALPAHFASTKSGYDDIVLSKVTGALREVKAKTEALDPQLIKDLGEAAATYASAVAAQRSADQGPSQLAKFKQRLGELEALLPVAAALGVPIPPELLALAGGGSAEEPDSQQADLEE